MAITEGINPIDSRLDKIERNCLGLMRGQTAINEQLGKINGRLGDVEDTCIRLQRGIADLQRGQKRLEKGQKEINARLDGMAGDIAEIKDLIKNGR